MLLADLVTTSERLAATPARNEKVALLAELLHRLEAPEVPIGVAYLSGHLRQGRIGLGWSVVGGVSYGTGGWLLRGATRRRARMSHRPSSP